MHFYRPGERPIVTGSCPLLLGFFWKSSTQHRASDDPAKWSLIKRDAPAYTTEKVQASAVRSVTVVKLSDISLLPRPTFGEVTAEPMQLTQLEAERVLEASGIEVDAPVRAAQQVAVSTVEQAYDDLQDAREWRDLAEHTPIAPTETRAPPKLPPRTAEEEQAIETGADQHAFVDVGIRQESLEYEGHPWMIHDGFDLQMALVHLAPHEQLGMEQHGEGVQLIYVLDGNLVVHTREPHTGRLDDITDVFYRCGAGQMVVIPRGVAHNVLNQSDDLPARAWQFYSPRVHPGERGVYAVKYSDNNAPNDFRLQLALTPEGRGTSEAAHLVDALLLALHSQEDFVLFSSDDVLVQSHVVRGDSGTVLMREGYYYVVAGRGEVFNHTGRVGTHDVKRSKSKKHRPMPVVPGSIFYVMPGSFAAIATSANDTAMHILAVVSPSSADVSRDDAVHEMEQEFFFNDMHVEETVNVPYEAPDVFVTEVLNATPTAPNDIQEVNLFGLVQSAMEARRQYIEGTDDEEESDETDSGDEEWDD